MRLYPDTPDDRGPRVARDALTLLTLFVLAWLALKVHDTVDKLAVLGAGVRESGEVVQNGFERAGEAAGGYRSWEARWPTRCATPARAPAARWRKPAPTARSACMTWPTCSASCSSRYPPRSSW